MDSAAHLFLYSSRLIDSLTEFDFTDKRISKEPFFERFGKFVDLQGGITLSKMLGNITTQSFTPASVPFSDILNTFFDTHREMVRFVATSFLPRSVPGKEKLPSPAEYHSYCRFTGVYDVERSDTPNNYTAAYNPYRKFYVFCQTYLEKGVHRLRSDVRGMMAGFSSEVAKLSSLDKGIEESLSLRTRQLFEKVPKFLGKQFKQLLDAHWQELPMQPAAKDFENWMTKGGWLWVFTQKMRELLFAEIEMRLLPVMGLVESIYSHY